MRAYGIVPSRIRSSRELARCGLVAGLLYSLGLSQTDPYGRLEASAEKLADDVLPSWVATGELTEAQILEARDRLIQAGLWHHYTVHGREYIEYEGHDADQQESHLRRRSLERRLPDPPDRPDLWAVNRLHYQAKRRKGSDESSESSQQPPEESSADLPPQESAQPTRVPSRGGTAEQAKSGMVREQPPSEREEFISEAVRQMARAHEQHSGQLLSSADHLKLQAVAADAWDAQVGWQQLVAVIQEKQAEYQPTRTAPRIKSVGYYLPALDEHIRAAKRDGLRAAGLDRVPTVPVPEEEDDPIAARVRQQAQQLLSAGDGND